MVVSSNEAANGLLSLSNNLADAVERAGRSIVAVDARHHVPSSGIYWKEGVVVTADHTIEREDGINVMLPNGETRPATVAGRDQGTDLAVLKIENAGLPTAELANGDRLKVGHIVLAVGRPGRTGLSASMGAISAVSSAWRTWSGGQIDQLVRPDLTLYPGFSGGPRRRGNYPLGPGSALHPLRRRLGRHGPRPRRAGRGRPAALPRRTRPHHLARGFRGKAS